MQAVTINCKFSLPRLSQEAVHIQMIGEHEEQLTMYSLDKCV